MGELQDTLKEIKELLVEQKGAKQKKFRYPFGKKVGRSQAKKNYVTVLVINENSRCEFLKYKIEEQTILHDLIPRLATSGHILHDKKGNPLIILPNWSVEPFSPLDHYKETLVNGSNKKGYQLLMNKMRLATVEAKKKIGNAVKWIGGALILGVIVYALLTSGGG